MTTYWNGVKVECERCGGERCEYRGDVDHDNGSCEVLECLDCGHRWHEEWPD